MNMTGLMMDENTIRIKNIVKPYEEKIKKLEDILRKKEFEIVVLKDKIKQIEKKNINPMIMNSIDNVMIMAQINNNNNNMMINPMNVNMMNQFGINMINPIMMNQIEEGMNPTIENNISINFYFKEELIFTIKCSTDEKFKNVIQRIKNKIGYIEKPLFIYNAKKINEDLTIAEAGITNNSNIFIVETKGIKGAASFEENNLSLSSDSNSSIEE